MPNHITNVLKITGDPSTIASMLEAVKQDEIGMGSIDFNKLIPTPEYVFQGNLGSEERAQSGKNNWYDWNIENWGTKWNSYGYEGLDHANFDGDKLEFLTAWSAPHPVIEKLATCYHELSFSHRWADEDLGYNVGEANYEQGKALSLSIPEGGSKEAMEMVADIMGFDLAEEGFIYNEKVGEYEYHDPYPAPDEMHM